MGGELKSKFSLSSVPGLPHRHMLAAHLLQSRAQYNTHVLDRDSAHIMPTSPQQHLMLLDTILTNQSNGILGHCPTSASADTINNSLPRLGILYISMQRAIYDHLGCQLARQDCMNTYKIHSMWYQLIGAQATHCSDRGVTAKHAKFLPNLPLPWIRDISAT